MAISTLCPNCKAVFRLPDNLAGRKVKCQKCEQQFTVPAAEAGAGSVPTIPAPQPKASPEAPKPKLPPIQLTEPASKPAKKKFDDEDDEAPLSESKPAKAKKKFDDEDDAPLDAFEDDDTQKRRRSGPPPIKSKSKSRDEDDDRERDRDEDDDRRPRRRKRPKQDSTGPWLMIGVIAACVLLVGGGIGLTSWLVMSGGDANIAPIVKLPPGGVPPGGVPLPGGAVIAANLDGNGFFSQNNQLAFGDATAQINFGNQILAHKGKYYSVNLEAGTTYQFDMRSNDLDAFLVLFDGQGKFLTLNDDLNIAVGLDSCIVWVAGSTGQHRIFATSLGGNEFGPYSLEIRRLAGPGIPFPKFPDPKFPDPKFPIPPVIGVDINVVFDGAGKYSQNNRLALNDRNDVIFKGHKVYRVPFEAGKRYTIDLKSQEFDAYLFLYSPTGQILDQNDDFQGLDSRIVHTAAQSGVYLIRASSLGGGREGNYTFSVVRDADPGKFDPFPKKDPFPKFDPFPKKNPFPKNPPAAETTAIFDGAGLYTHNGQLDPNDRSDIIDRPHKIYRVSFEAGRRYTIDLVSNNFDPYLYLHSPAGQLLVSDDDGGGYPNARIVFDATQTGVHIVRASHFSGQGDFTLTIRRDNAPGKIDPFPKKDPFPKIDPPKAGASIASPPTQTGAATIRSLSLPGGLIGAAMPAWSADGRSLFHVALDGKIHRFRSTDFVPDGVGDLRQLCSDFAVSSEGPVAVPANANGVLLIDPATLAIKRTIAGGATFQHVAAVPGSHLAVAYTFGASTIALVDLKEGILVGQGIQKKPATLTSVRTVAMSPDGRTVVLQGSDKLHRLRVENNQLLWEDSAPLVDKTAIQLAFSPDGKLLSCCSLSLVKTKAANEASKLFQAGTWNPAAFNLPFQARAVGFLGDGAVVAQKKTDDGALVLFPAPAAAKSVDLNWSVASHGYARSITAQPQGNGFLVLASPTGSGNGVRAYFVEPTTK